MCGVGQTHLHSGDVLVVEHVLDVSENDRGFADAALPEQNNFEVISVASPTADSTVHSLSTGFFSRLINVLGNYALQCFEYPIETRDECVIAPGSTRQS